MEKTLARAIFKKMEIGKEYTTRDLVRLIDDDYYGYIPVDQHPGQPNGKPCSVVVSSEMWKVVNSGFAKTYTNEETLANVRGLRYGSKPTSFTTYNIRCWVRIK
jgi:hypothetical protein